MSRHARRLPTHVTFSLFALAALLVPTVSSAEPIVCRSLAPVVKAVTIAEDYFKVTRYFQFDTPNLEPMLETTISVTGTGPTCVFAYRRPVGGPEPLKSGNCRPESPLAPFPRRRQPCY